MRALGASSNLGWRWLWPWAGTLACVLSPTGIGATPHGELEVTVTGPPRHPLAPRHNRDVSGSVITRQRLAEPGVELASLLRFEPAIQTSALGGVGAPSFVSLRGALALQTPVYLAGIRLNDEHSGAFDLSQVPPWFIERVEVYRSHGPLDVPDSGIAGALYIEPLVPRKSETRVGALTGSHGSRGAWAVAGAASADGGVLAGVRGIGADNAYPYLDDRGTLFDASDDRRSHRVNADTATKDAWLTVKRPLGPIDVRIIGNAFGREQGAPRLALLPSRRARERASRELLAISTELATASGVSLATTSYVLSTGHELSDPLGELALGAVGLRYREIRSGSAIVIRRRLPAHGASVVLGYAQGRLLRTVMPVYPATDSSVPSALRLAPRIGSSLVWSPVDWARASVEGAFELHRTECEPERPREFLALPWHVGVAADYGQITLYGGHGGSERTPSLSELFGASALVRGNARLRPERASTTELGLRWTAGRHSSLRPPWIDLALFMRRSEDLVTFVRSGEGYVMPVNLRAALVRGAEIVAGIEVVPGVTVSSSVSLLDPRDRSPDRQSKNDLLSYVARLTAVLRIDAELPWRTEEIGPAILGVELVHTSSRFADRAGLEVIPAQTVADISARIAALGGSMSGSVRVMNVLGERRFDLIGFPLPGRVVMVAMEVKW